MINENILCLLFLFISINLMFNGSIKSIWERSCRTHFRHHKLEFSCLLETFLVLGQNCGLLSGIQVVVVKLSEGVAFV